MKTPGTYGPEDLEYLLANKRFDELYPEEKAYVLEHMENETEYGELRNILLKMEEPDLVDIAPSPRMRESLMDMHRDHHKKPSFKIWLNSLFSGFIMHDLARKPAFQFATLACILLLGLWTMPDKKSTDLADKPTINGPSAPLAEEQSDFKANETTEAESRTKLSTEDDGDKSVATEGIEGSTSLEAIESKSELQSEMSASYSSDELEESDFEEPIEMKEEIYHSDSELGNDIQLDMDDTEIFSEGLERERLEEDVRFSATPVTTEASIPSIARKLADVPTESDKLAILTPNTSVSSNVIEILYTSW
jgi:hypothetical protein